MPHISPLWWVVLAVWFVVMLGITFVILNWSSSARIHLIKPAFGSSYSNWEWN